MTRGGQSQEGGALEFVTRAQGCLIAGTIKPSGGVRGGKNNPLPLSRAGGLARAGGVKMLSIGLKGVPGACHF